LGAPDPKLVQFEKEVAVKILLILNDPPYGTERTYNGLRLALALAKSDPANTVTVFLMADAVAAQAHIAPLATYRSAQDPGPTAGRKHLKGEPCHAADEVKARLREPRNCKR
jgi:sulfur relay (sulfurtransferase) complex TusBCD TusD component (DsrE family)